MPAEICIENYLLEQKIKCSVDDVSKSVELSIKNLIKKQGYLTYDIYTQKVLTSGSFLGELYEIDVNGKTKEGHKEINLFLKIMNGNDAKWVSLPNIYRIEWFAYRELSEIFAELQEDANIPSHERYKMVKSYEDSSTEAIILENIARKGFQLYDRMKVVTLEFAEIAITQLAKLHGLSFALQEKRPDYFNRNIKVIKFPINFGDDQNEFMQSMIHISMQYIDDDDIKNRVRNTYCKLADKYAKFFEDEATRRCLCYGDYRSSNMMIKMNNEKVTDFIAVDYQFLYYGCPVMDILFFIFLNTDQQFRKAHLSHLKDLYHETLTTFLGYFNMDVDLVYSREMFEQDFKAKLDYGLLVGFAILPITLVNENDVPDVTGDMSELNFQVNDVYRDRQRGMIEEFTEWGYIL